MSSISQPDCLEEAATAALSLLEGSLVKRIKEVKSNNWVEMIFLSLLRN
jgi:hypothetical protein